MSYKKTYLLFSLVTCLVLSGSQAVFAEADFKVAGWLPYWKASESMKDAKSHLSSLDSVYPFGYTLQSDGTIKDLFNVKNSASTRFFKSARSNYVEIIPTVMTSSGKDSFTVLSNDVLRKKHIEEIASMIKKGKFDGVDIDYEGKWAETRPYFSLFLKELKQKIGGKVLSCTIEARTPPEDLYKQVPKTLEYSNDFEYIGKHCDRVQIMAYDQQRADLKLNSQKIGLPYVPLADVDWVRKVVLHTIKTIPKEKIMLGVPTYGHEYEITASPEKFNGYKKLWALNPVYATDTAKEYKLQPSRSRAGEMSFSYFATSSPFRVLKSVSVSPQTASGDVVAMQALTFANNAKTQVKFNLIIWTDKEAVKQKVDLARELGLRGVAIFKIDNGEDKGIWDLF